MRYSCFRKCLTDEIDVILCFTTVTDQNQQFHLETNLDDSFLFLENVTLHGVVSLYNNTVLAFMMISF